MYIQHCVKGIAGSTGIGASTGVTKIEAFDLVASGKGIISNWWRKKNTIRPEEIASVINEGNLNRHIHDYAVFGADTPFISLTAGCVERDVLISSNNIYSAVDTALLFATGAWAHPGALFYCWTPVGYNKAVDVLAVAEAVRDLNVYHRWSIYQLEGEITAKVHIPANQIKCVEWWDGSIRKDAAVDTLTNHTYIDPKPITNMKEYF